MQLLKVAMLQAILTVQFGINAWLRIIVITHYNACYVISIGNRMYLHAIKE